MGSLQERMKVMKRIQVEGTEDFVVELLHHGESMGEFVLNFTEAEFSVYRESGSKIRNVSISIRNPADNSLTEYTSK